MCKESKDKSPSDKDLNEAFVIADKDKGGTVDCEEFVHLYKLVKAGKVHGLSGSAFDLFGTSKDSKKKEFRNSLRETELAGGLKGLAEPTFEPDDAVACLTVDERDTLRNKFDKYLAKRGNGAKVLSKELFIDFVKKVFVIFMMSRSVVVKVSSPCRQMCKDEAPSEKDLNEAFVIADEDKGGTVDCEEFIHLYELIKAGKVHGLYKDGIMSLINGDGASKKDKLRGSLKVKREERTTIQATVRIAEEKKKAHIKDVERTPEVVSCSTFGVEQ
jgi:Ca2+-binding EF-hand superfamily protein